MYYLLLAFIYPLSLLPLWVLYRLSDLAYFLLYHVTGYRKDVVRDNLSHAFPQKTEAERELILRRFYRSFCDQWIETIKLLSISKRALSRRFDGNWEVFQDLGREGKNTFAMLGHTYNWEWANAVCPIHSPQPYYCVYLPLSSKSFDRLMLRIRSRTGAKMVSMKALKSGLAAMQAESPYILALAADQNPSVTETALWLSFMNREAPFFRGGEAMARRAKGAVVFAGIRKVRRGYYRIELTRAFDDASQAAAGDVTRAYARFVEAQLEAQPENYLWSHRRWKHVRKTVTTG